MRDYLWDQRQITKWAMTTFGPPDSIEVIVDRAGDEFDEMVIEIDSENYDKVPGELADIMIMLMQVAEHLGVDLLEEVDKKMDINSTRTWSVKGNGTGKHT
jgi:NTP pyrophosphatase (non-canonical NTP hydrolase)